ncbi:unnamed protein product [Spirodela intermedia]|uniref:Uncharacterized protein n=1 Tax=Spirodela intermedia TaxID=51605 RepID=A0A7I8I8Q9_SPIIN|nr:unnamed protein product [Spirodela intermedia]CAA6654045.1 unnamed protein product [Spirodela intermedia]
MELLLLGGGGGAAAPKPSHLAYPFVLKAASALSMVELGRQVHAQICKLGFHGDLFVGNSLIDMYCKCSLMEDARKLFDGMPDRDQVSWNSIISGYASCGRTSCSLQLFDEMPASGNAPPKRRHDGLPLAACSSSCNWPAGRWVSSFIDVNAVPVNVMVTTALVDMHCRCGALTEARRRFDEAPQKNLATWNAMMTGYVRGGRPESAVNLFSHMTATSLAPNEITLVNLLSAFASMGALERGKEAHVDLARSGADVNVFLSTALVDMYAKCGEITLACLVFVKAARKDLGLWNAMVTGLAAHGLAAEALTVFSQMSSAGAAPNEVTFVGILSACSHAGLVDAGRENFRKMRKVYGLKPDLEHYACMVDLLGRAGHVEEALAMVEDMEMEPDFVIWGSLLNACRIHHEIELAEKISKAVVFSSSKVANLGCSVLLSNIFASAGMWAEVARVRRLMKETGERKVSGCSWMEAEGAMHRFLVKDTAHDGSSELYVTLDTSLVDGRGGMEERFNGA